MTNQRPPTSGCFVFLLGLLYSTLLTVFLIFDLVIPGVVCGQSIQTKRCVEFRASFLGGVWNRNFDMYQKDTP